MTRTEHKPVSHTFDALSDDYFRDPALHFKPVRDEMPVFWYPHLNSWVATRKADVEAILSDWKRFRNGTKGESIIVPEKFQDVVPRDLFVNILVGSDPPRHTANRAIAQRGFVKARMDALQPVIERRAHKILDSIQDLGAANLMDAYSLELTTQTFMALIDLPEEDEPMMRQLRDDLLRILGSALEPMPEPELTEVWTRYVEAQLHLRKYAVERAEHPGEDLISIMASALDRDGHPAMSPEQVALHIGEFAGAATDTTAQAMTNAVLFLDQHPTALAEAQADPALWEHVFDETVRRRPSGTGTRWATEDLEIGGAHIKAGDAIWLGLASANTDADYYERPFDFDIHRPLGDHLAFTKGRHTCLGQPLARVQGTTGLKVLYERLPTLRPADSVPIDFLPLVLLPVRRTLPVVWEKPDGSQPRRSATTGKELHTRQVLVRGRKVASDGVVTIDLIDPAGGELPAWTVGSHVDVVVGDGSARQYSLSSDPADRSSYRIGVLREADGRGGSEYLHDHVVPGDVLTISVPRNNFELVDSQRYLFVAGGIGITPILPMIRAAQAAGAEWKLLYGGRSRTSMAFLDELARYGDTVSVSPEDEQGLLDLASWLHDPVEDTVVYACGPEPLLRAVEGTMSRWPSGSLHVEHFTPKSIEVDGDDEEFLVEFAQTGETVVIPPDRTILQMAESVGINVFSSCQEGTCGTCETTILDGRAEHRDSLLTPDEEEAQDTMFICVSRAERGCDKLTLDL